MTKIITGEVSKVRQTSSGFALLIEEMWFNGWGKAVYKDTVPVQSIEEADLVTVEFVEKPDKKGKVWKNILKVKLGSPDDGVTEEDLDVSVEPKPAGEVEPKKVAEDNSERWLSPSDTKIMVDEMINSGRERWVKECASRIYAGWVQPNAPLNQKDFEKICEIINNAKSETQLSSNNKDESGKDKTVRS